MINNKTCLFSCLIEGAWDKVPLLYDNTNEYRTYLFKEYKRRILNGIYQVTFGADTYCAFRTQKEYMWNQIVKSWGVSMEVSFRRIDVLANIMRHFPPLARHRRLVNQAKWLQFEDMKDLNEVEIQEIKYGLLPEAFKD